MSDKPPPFKVVWQEKVRALDGLRPPVLKLVALVLSTYADRDGTNVFPGEERLARECGIKVRAARGHLTTLRDAGLIVRTFRGSTMGRARVADVYTLVWPKDVESRVEKAIEKRDEKRNTGSTVPVNNPEEHRHDGAGDDGNTGTSVHEHRHVGAPNTGTTVPPTKPLTNPETKSTHRIHDPYCHAREELAQVEPARSLARIDASDRADVTDTERRTS